MIFQMIFFHFKIALDYDGLLFKSLKLIFVIVEGNVQS